MKGEEIQKQMDLPRQEIFAIIIIVISFMMILIMTIIVIMTLTGAFQYCLETPQNAANCLHNLCPNTRPQCNCVQITCNISGAYDVRHVV